MTNALKIWLKIGHLLPLIGLGLMTLGQSESDTTTINDDLQDIVEDAINKEDSEELNYRNLEIDTSNVDVRHFNKASMDKYLNDPEFNYQEEKNKENWLMRQLQRFLNWLFGRVIGLGPLFKVLKYILIIGFIGLLLYIIARMTGMHTYLFRPDKKESKEIPFEELEKNIHEVDFDSLLKQAKADGNYRAAVRLQHLKSLRLLSDEGLIQYQIDKTNREYGYELSNKQLRNHFLSRTGIYEYVWYGEFEIDGKTYDQIAALYEDMHNEIKLIPHA